MDRMLLPLIGLLAVVLASGGGVWWWDRHPPIHWHGPIPFLGPDIRLPDSLLTQRDNALAAQRKAEAGARACGVALDGQNRAVRALAAEGARKLAAAERAMRDRAAVAESYRQTAAALQDYQPRGDRTCDRLADADGAVLDALR